MIARIIGAIAVIVTTGAAQAEVRIVRGSAGPVLSIRPGARGVWTPTGVADATALNPGGDLLGDGYPGQLTVDGELVAAWQRPASGSLVIVRATSIILPPEAMAVGTSAGVGVPVITKLDAGRLIAWQVGDLEPHVVGLVTAGGVASEPVTLVPGRLVGIYTVGTAIHLVAASSADPALAVATLSTAYFPSPIPVPITRVALRSWEPNPIPIPVTRTTADLASPTWMPCVEERGDDVLVAWQAGRGIIGRITLDAYGVNGAGEFFRGPSGSCQAILNAASRQ